MRCGARRGCSTSRTWDGCDSTGRTPAGFWTASLTRRVADLPPGKIRYSLVTNEQGGILDDILASQFETPSGRRYYLLVVNASNREKIVAWFRSLADARPTAMSRWPIGRPRRR